MSPENGVKTAQPKIRFSLGLKFVSVMVVVLTFIMFTIGLILVNQAKQIVINDINQKSKTYASFLSKIGQQQLKAGDLSILQRYALEVSSDSDVLYVLILDTKNKPIVHTERKTRDITGALEVNFPIYSKGTRIGTIKIWYSFYRVVQELTEGAQYVLSLVIILSIIILGMVMFLVSEKMIFTRIGIIIQTMNKIKKGDLSARVRALGRDELGLLSDHFNNMLEEIEENQKELTLLFEGTRTITATLDINLINDLVMEILINQLNAVSCCIFILQEDTLLHVRGMRGLSTEFIKNKGLNVLEDLAHKSLFYNQPVVINDVEKESTVLKDTLTNQKIYSSITIPLIVQDRTLGVLNINYSKKSAFPDRRVNLLLAFARQLAVTLQNAQLYERTQVFSKELEDKINIATGNLARANERLKLANEKLAELNQAKSDFVTIVSHELRAPLTNILGFADLVLTGEAGEITPTQREFIDIINHNTKRLIELISNLLNLSRIEAGKVEIKKEPITIEDIIKNVVNNFQLQLKEKDLETIFDFPVAPVSLVYADANQITQVLTNLVSNTVKYSNIGGAVILRAREEDDMVRIEVCDTGEGIDRKELSHMFEKFYRSAKSRAQNILGSGLGLTIAKSIIEMHNGKIWVESPLPEKEKNLLSSELKNSKGTKFCFTLPKA